MNTGKQINVMIGLLMVMLIATTLYFVWDRQRENTATARQNEVNAERGAHLFSLNCRSCHGISGLGALERRGLPGAVLNDESNQVSAPAELAAKHLRFAYTIKCGRVGTLMPPWGVDQGGSLNNFQIDQLLALITGTMPGFDPPADPAEVSETAWHLAMEEANHADAFEIPRELEEEIDAEVTTIALNAVLEIEPSTDEDEVLLRIDDDPTDEIYELVKVIDVDEEAFEIEVERGASGTEAAEHEAGAEVFKGLAAPPTEPLTGQTAPAPCGQNTVQPPATPGPPIPVTGDISMTLQDNFFELDDTENPSLQVATGATVNVSLANDGSAIHNMRVSGADGELDTDDDHVSDPDAIDGGATATLSFSFDEAGTYAYKCDFHPVDMVGEIIVE